MHEHCIKEGCKTTITTTTKHNLNLSVKVVITTDIDKECHFQFFRFVVMSSNMSFFSG